VAASAHADDLQVDAARRFDFPLIAVQNIFFDPGEVGRLRTGFDGNGFPRVRSPELPVVFIFPKFPDQDFLVNQRACGNAGFDEFLLHAAEELLDHEIRVAFRVKEPLLGVLARQADVFVQVEAADAAGVQLPFIGRPGEVLIEPRGRVSRGQAQHRLVLFLQDADGFPDGNGRCHLAQLRKVFGYEDADSHDEFSPFVLPQFAFDHIGNLPAVFFRHRVGRSLHHDAAHILRSRVAHQHAPFAAQFAFRLPNGFDELRHVFNVRFALHVHIDQFLRKNIHHPR